MIDPICTLTHHDRSHPNHRDRYQSISSSVATQMVLTMDHDMMQVWQLP